MSLSNDGEIEISFCWVAFMFSSRSSSHSKRHVLKAMWEKVS